MKTLSTSFADHLRGTGTTLAFCWQLSLRDGTIYGFTSHDQPLTIAGVTYLPQNAIAPSAYQQDLSLSADDVELSAVFSSEQITEQDLAAGRLDSASYLFFLVNWQALPASLTAVPQDYLELSAGRLGGYSASTKTFKAEALSIVERLAEAQPIQTSPVCRATLGDTQCKVDLTPYTHSLTIVSATGRVITTSELDRPDGYFTGGTVEFLTGANAPEIFRVEGWINSSNQLTLFLPPGRPVAPGDTIRCVAGCDKRLVTCRDTYNNVVNFRAEPSIPGQDVWTSGTPVDGPDNDE